MNSALLILTITYLPVVVSAAIVLAKRKQFNKEFRFFSGFLVTTAILQLISGVLFYKSTNNMPLSHLYTGLGGILLIFFYRDLFKDVLSPKILNVLAAIYAAFVLVNSLFFESIFAFNSNSLTIEAAVVVMLSLAFFNLALREKLEKEKHLFTYQWINSGLFIYFTANLLLYYFGDYLMQEVFSGTRFLNIWTLHSLATFAAYTCYFIDLWKILKRSK